VAQRIQVGRGTADLVDPDYSDVYLEIVTDMAEDLGLDPEDLVFLDDLRNNGERGAGLAVLREALREARAHGLVLVLLALSDHDQDRLRSWYLGTGLLLQVPTRRGRKLNVLMDREAAERLSTRLRVSA
jgi:hypothetical protein